MKTLVKRILQNFPKVYALAAKIHRYSSNCPNEHDVLDRFARVEKDVCFIQIGAHDGKSDDHLYSFVRSYGWKGILFEPVKELFDALSANYAGVAGIVLENKAVTSQSGMRPFYRLADIDGQSPAWHTQLGSFSKEVVLSHRWQIPDIDARLVEESVSCITVEKAMADHGFDRVDLLLVDTEGEDFNILQSINFGKIAPKMIIYERVHLSDNDLERCRSMLSSAGYRVKPLGGLNDIAVREDVAGRYSYF